MRRSQVFLACMLILPIGCGKSDEKNGEKKPDLGPRIEKLRKVSKAMHDYAAVDGHEKRYPAYNSNGLVPNRGEKRNYGLSWRVYILPSLGYKELYDQFNLDEPWDSPNNKKLLSKMPSEYQSHGVSKPGFTSLHLFVEPPVRSSYRIGRVPFSYFVQYVFIGPQLRGIMDGTRHTLMFVEAGANKATPWTKPTYLKFDRKTISVDVLGETDDEGFLFVYFYGTVGRISKSISKTDLLLLLEHRDHKTDSRKVVDFDGVERLE